MIHLMTGDVLERLRRIPSKSVELILTDIPAAPREAVWAELERVISPSGAAVMVSALVPLPAAILEQIIQAYTGVGGTVLDFSMGAGETGVACANTGRRFVGIEHDLGDAKTAQEDIWAAAAQVRTVSSAGVFS
ncbi:unnamed protein product [marine sediment metagenome]|uniref:DNA methylase N-4/N-6 domain-containing protein n=1 Tax=marine sediment metagenome TaxID=412755 RepID=X0RKU5_9ZZZZ